MGSKQLNASNMMAMMNGRCISPSDKKKALGGASGCHQSQQQDTLLGMASTLFRGENFARSFPAHPPIPSFYPNIHDASATASRRNHAFSTPFDIMSQALSELDDDDSMMYEPPSEDIFDLEPVPLPPNHQHQQQQQQQQENSSNRLSMLEDTLNQVLIIEDMFMEEAPMPRTVPQPQALASAATSKRSMECPSPAPSSSKRQRTSAPGSTSSLDAEDEEEAARRFRPYQAEQWSEKFEELLKFRTERGHCCVPHTFDENPSLARWVKRQRYQYKLKMEDKPSTMTDERIVALEQTGFVWDSHGAAWMERWNELVEFQKQHGHANVPSNYSQSPQLATWVKCQRRQYKLFCNGKATNMTLERLQRLESCGFEWQLRSGGNNINHMAEHDHDHHQQQQQQGATPFYHSSLTPSQQALANFHFSY